MITEVVSIGDEVLRGSIVNTNSAFISKELLKIGIKVSRQTVLSDEPVLLKEGLAECYDRADLVLCTGGLGPTLDDITREVVADLFGCEFYFDEKVAEDLRKRYGDLAISLDNQATLPKGAHVLKNRVGTAPGLAFSSDQKKMILLPGVPREMQHILLEEVIPYLQKHYAKKDLLVSETLHLSLLSESSIDPLLRKIHTQYPDLEIGIYPCHGTVSLSFLSPRQEEVRQSVQRVQQEFEEYLFLSPSGKIEEAVHAWMIENKKTLAFAESCTGGSLASAITALPGASDYFLGSLVTYSNALKMNVLSVPESILKEKGAVSAETVLSMVEGLLKVTGADYGIAVSGIAGPTGATPGKPIGTIWAAIAERGSPPEVGSFLSFGNRNAIIFSTVNKLLASFYRKLVFGTPCFPLISSSDK